MPKYTTRCLSPLSAVLLMCGGLVQFWLFANWLWMWGELHVRLV